MLDPITISAVVGGAKALKSAFDAAKSAMDEFRACAEAGMDAKQSFGKLINVFVAHGETQKSINEVRKLKDAPAPVNADGSPAKAISKKSATVIALEAMQIERELREQEEEIKHYLIYQCQEPGLYEELCSRRDAIAKEEAMEEEAKIRASTELLLEKKRVELSNRRRIQKIYDSIYKVIATIVTAGIIGAFVMFIRWMFDQEGTL